MRKSTINFRQIIFTILVKLYKLYNSSQNHMNFDQQFSRKIITTYSVFGITFKTFN